MSKLMISAALLLLVAALPVQSDELTDSVLKLCEKVKSCASAQVAAQNLTPEQRQMMQPMLDNMCANIRGKVQEVPSGHPLYAPALACMRSMESLTCQTMQESESVRTPQCEAYEKLAQEAGSSS